MAEGGSAGGWQHWMCYDERWAAQGRQAYEGYVEKPEENGDGDTGEQQKYFYRAIQ